ncbi:FG-GAP-like repeat-containing protein [Streptomyces sp. NPDC101132]|uniref:FG-GAP-like repeat-containing protein n=1 Tax=Streptomyces sp. NPDC101132 TaxID=3366110 RepID=UPI0038017FFE
MKLITRLAACAATAAIAAGSLAGPAQGAAARTHGDMNGDGKTDITVSGGFGAPGHQLQIIPGGTVGRLGSALPAAVISQDTPGVPGKAGEYDGWGEVLAYGDFNRDGRADVAVGAPRDTVDGASWAGSVTVLYGRSGTPYFSQGQRFTQSTPGVPGEAEPSDAFGEALAAGDFNGDGYTDLAIGAPGEQFGTHYDAGSVTVLKGGANGLTGVGAKSFSQNTAGVPGSVGTRNRFGLRLIAANVAGDTKKELIVVSPGDPGSGEVQPCTENGQVWHYTTQGSLTVLRGTSGGPATSGLQYLDPAKLGIHGFSGYYAGGSTGTPGVAAKFYGGPYEDLAFATPNARNGICGEGAVAVLRGGPNGLGTKPAVLTAAKAGKPRLPGKDWGFNLAAGDVDGDGRADLYAPCNWCEEDRLGYTAILFGTPTGLGAGGRRWVWVNPYERERTRNAAMLDVDGDRRSELLLSYPDVAPAGGKPGVARVLKFAPSGTGVRIAAQQRLTRSTVGSGASYGPQGPFAQ